MQSEIIELNEKALKDKIFVVRNQKVMLDSDLAQIYGYTTRAFNQQVQRNINKFDDDFMFQLTTEETYKIARSQNVTSIQIKGIRGGRTSCPYVFTEQGIYMLMTVLKGELAVKQSKTLIRLFKEMKNYIIYNNSLNSYNDIINLALQTKENANDINQIKNELTTIHKLLDLKFDKEILILNGQQVESNLAYKKIYSLAKKSIYIIDDYISLKTLVLLKDVDKDVKITIFSDNVNNKLHRIEFEDFIKQYPDVNLAFKVTNNQCHDRYIIIDYGCNTECIFHCGASSKDSGKKITSINRISDIKLYKKIIDDISNNEELILK